MELEFPIEFIVLGTAVSLQAKRRVSVEQWKQRIIKDSRKGLPNPHFATDEPIAVTLYYFPDTEMEGDVDNIVKPILDALTRHIYIDDHQVERVTVQKFEPGRVFQFGMPSAILEAALISAKPCLYVRLANDVSEELN